MMKVFCKIFGHDWKYNFKSIADKRTCRRCGIVHQLNLNKLTYDSNKEKK